MARQLRGPVNTRLGASKARPPQAAYFKNSLSLWARVLRCSGLAAGGGSAGREPSGAAATRARRGAGKGARWALSMVLGAPPPRSPAPERAQV